MNHYLIFGLGFFFGTFCGFLALALFAGASRTNDCWTYRDGTYDVPKGHETARDMLMRGDI
jgi:hypothetical protein